MRNFFLQILDIFKPCICPPAPPPSIISNYTPVGTEQEAVNIEPEQLQTNSTAPDLVSAHKNAKKKWRKTSRTFCIY